MKTALALVLTAVAFTGPATAHQSVAVTRGGGHSSTTITVPFGKPARFNNLLIRSVEVVEDSRCPRYVTCVWRGRLKVRFALSHGQTLTLEDNKPMKFAGGTLTLLGATPLSGRGEKIPLQAYNFQLRFERG